jgi:hypothetical protein
MGAPNTMPKAAWRVVVIDTNHAVITFHNGIFEVEAGETSHYRCAFSMRHDDPNAAALLPALSSPLPESHRPIKPPSFSIATTVAAVAEDPSDVYVPPPFL